MARSKFKGRKGRKKTYKKKRKTPHQSGTFVPDGTTSGTRKFKAKRARRRLSKPSFESRLRKVETVCKETVPNFSTHTRIVGLPFVMRESLLPDIKRTYVLESVMTDQELRSTIDGIKARTAVTDDEKAWITMRKASLRLVNQWHHACKVRACFYVCVSDTADSALEIARQRAIDRTLVPGTEQSEVPASLGVTSYVPPYVENNIVEYNESYMTSPGIGEWWRKLGKVISRKIDPGDEMFISCSLPTLLYDFERNSDGTSDYHKGIRVQCLIEVSGSLGYNNFGSTPFTQVIHNTGFHVDGYLQTSYKAKVLDGEGSRTINWISNLDSAALPASNRVLRAQKPRHEVFQGTNN